MAHPAEEQQVVIAISSVERVGFASYGVVDDAGKSVLGRKQRFGRPADGVVPAFVAPEDVKRVSGKATVQGCEDRGLHQARGC